MRIAHIVTYVSEDGAYGGPIAVARAQTAELARRGHDVKLLAGWDGRARLSIPGVDVRLFPVRRVAPGFSGLVAPGLQRHLRMSLASYDALHVHLARDLVTLPAARLGLRTGTRVVAQTHGMVMPDERLRARALDTLITRKVLTSADAVLALTDAEEIGIRQTLHDGDVKLMRIANGIEVRRGIAARQGGRRTVLFLARLHPRKRVMAFAEAASILLDRGVDAWFRIVGPDEGDLSRLKAFLAQRTDDDRRIEYVGSVAPGEGVHEIADASIYVLPSRGEVFPMTVLEALSVGTPVILGDDCAIGPELQRRGAAMLAGAAPIELASSIEVLLNDPRRRDAQVVAGNEALSNWLSIGAVVDTLESVYA